MTDLQSLERDGLSQIEAAGDSAALEAARVALLGRRGAVTLLARELGGLPEDERRERGAALNRLRTGIEARLVERRSELAQAELAKRMAGERADPTLPPRPEASGRLHPVSRVSEEIVAIFADLGFDLREGPDIETEHYNFDALNMPDEHPARQEHDTFFLSSGEGRRVLRTHTSPVQIRTLEQGPPVRFIAPGRTYRCDSDLTHSPMFHQVEGMAIDRDMTMGHLRWVLEEFCRAFFEVESVDLRFRASHFPFTEPSAEVDLRCSWKDGRLAFGEGDDWLEILGCGMVHPNVLSACGVDPEAWQGFAFGLGIDRVAMLKYGMPDLRAFFEGDVRWLRHYGFDPLRAPSAHAGLGGGRCG